MVYIALKKKWPNKKPVAVPPQWLDEKGELTSSFILLFINKKVWKLYHDYHIDLCLLHLSNC